MTDAPPTQSGAISAEEAARVGRLRAGLKRRYAREGRFKLYGLLAIGVAVGFLLLLLGRIIDQGHTAFYAHTVTLPVYMDPARVDRAYPQGTNFELLVAEQHLARLGIVDDATGSKASEMRGLFSTELKFVAAERIQDQPGLIGQTVTIAAPASDDADLLVVELDRQGGLGDQDREGLVPVDPTEGDFLSGDHDHPGVGCASLHPDWLR